MKISKNYLLLFIFLILSTSVICQESEITSDPKREEIQRYFGYEALLPGYLTLPVDISMNTNERGYFLDIGFLFIILFPLLILKRLRSANKFYLIFTICFLIGVQSLYVNSSFIMSKDSTKIIHGQISNYTEQNSNIFETTLAQFYIGNNAIGEQLNNFLLKFTGLQDHITYPTLVFLLIILIVLISKLNLSKGNELLATILVVYGFFWLVLSSGIIWYGYLLFPILLLIILSNIKGKVTKYFIAGSISVWVCISLVSRISFITPFYQSKENLGKYIINPMLAKRSLGLVTTSELLETIHPGLNVIQQRINSENESLVLKIGTTLNYFILDNPSRIFQDNQLESFSNYDLYFKNNSDINIALKETGFKYMLIDLNTHTVDRTPEQTLKKKFARLLQYLQSNNGLKLLGTDRIVESTTSQGSKSYIYGINGKIYQPGSYAVFEIL